MQSDRTETGAIVKREGKKTTEKLIWHTDKIFAIKLDRHYSTNMSEGKF